MRYRLGSFQPRAGSSDYAHLMEDEELGAPMTRALEEMLGVRLSTPAAVEASDDQPPAPGAADGGWAGPARRPWRHPWLRPTAPVRPDLLAALGPTHPDYAWVRTVCARLRLLRIRLERVRLLACEYEPGPSGFLTLAASAAGRRVQAFPGDRMQLGFAAMRDGETAVKLWPRLLREVCRNGSLVSIGRFVHHEGEAGIGEAVDRCFSTATYEPALQDLQTMRATSVEDPRAYLDELQRIHDGSALLRRYEERIMRRFRDDGDGSGYGLMNAVTATAREVTDWRDRLDLEEFAGRMARLKRPVPSRSGGGALIPA